jgi:uncharacterized beta-barrel protein YwiB (DUF1934 family)
MIADHDLVKKSFGPMISDHAFYNKFNMNILYMASYKQCSNKHFLEFKKTQKDGCIKTTLKKSSFITMLLK